MRPRRQPTPTKNESRVITNGYPFVGIFFFFNDTATTEIYTLSLHDALPIFGSMLERSRFSATIAFSAWRSFRSEEHTSELQSRRDLVCRLLLEKKKCHFGFNHASRSATVTTSALGSGSLL